MPKPPLANKLVDRVTLHFDGRDWQLVVNYNVICDIEGLTGVNALYGTESILTSPSARMIRALLYLCLREQGAEYTLQEVGERINLGNLKAITEAIWMAWMASMPKKEEVDGEAGKLKAVAS